MSYRVASAIVLTLVLGAHVFALDCTELLSLSPDSVAHFLQANGRSADPKCVTEAIYRLGHLQSKATDSEIEAVISLLDFRRPKTSQEEMHISSMADLYPAVDALFEMRASAIPHLVADLKGGQMAPIARKNGIRTIVNSSSESPSQAVKVLKNAAREAANQAEAAQLESCAREAAQQCNKSRKQECAVALESN
jgi:hypothetical protein